MRKRMLALGLALAMCLGLCVTALASEEEAPDVEGFEAIGVKFSNVSLIHLSENIFLSSAGDWSAKPGEYVKITAGTQITVSNTGTDDSAYVFIELDPYYYSPEQQSVEGQRTYYSMDDIISLSRQGDDDELFGPASNGLYWNYEWSEPDNVELYPGGSVTFTLPEPDKDEDVIYVLWCYIYYPEYGCYFYRNYLMSYSDLPHVSTASATPTSSTVLVNGKNVSFDAYNINGNNYFKLRDIGQTFDFGVGWDGATSTITIDTARGYTAG